MAIPCKHHAIIETILPVCTGTDNSHIEEGITMNTNKIIAALSGLCLAASMAASAVVQAQHPIAYMPLDYYDINMDGDVDIVDAVSLVKYLHGRSMPDMIGRADIDGDGQVDVFDLGLFLRLLVNEGVIEEQQAELVESEYKAKKLSAKFSASAGAETVDPGEDVILGQTKFALDLVKLTAKDQVGQNVLVSPYSVSQALGMTANGAQNDTRTEMETVLGGKMEALNPAFSKMRTTAPNTKDAKLSTANSIWVRDGYAVRDDFLQTNADFYGADAFSTPMDHSTVEDVNNWVNYNTDQMIPSIIGDGDITDQTEIILANAVAFDAKWERPYTPYDIHQTTFTAADGTEQTVDMMGRDFYTYLVDEHATGFLQYYKGGQYAFAAILPEEGMTPEAYLDGLTAERLHTMLTKPVNTKVITGLPEFEYDFGTNLNEPLQEMGMTRAFQSGIADFYGMTDDERGLYIGKVIHKTHIEVTPVGTRAGAATVVAMEAGAALDPEPPKEVILNRPFVYAIVDTKTSLPVFIGTVNSIPQK